MECRSNSSAEHSPQRSNGGRGRQAVNNQKKKLHSDTYYTTAVKQVQESHIPCPVLLSIARNAAVRTKTHRRNKHKGKTQCNKTVATWRRPRDPPKLNKRIDRRFDNKAIQHRPRAETCTRSTGPLVRNPTIRKTGSNFSEIVKERGGVLDGNHTKNSSMKGREILGLA